MFQLSIQLLLHMIGWSYQHTCQKYTLEGRLFSSEMQTMLELQGIFKHIFLLKDPQKYSLGM